MPRVPEYEPNVQLRPEFRQGIDIQATPEAFGAAVGRGMQGFAQGLENLGDAVTKVNALKDDATIKDLRTKWSADRDKLLYDPDTGYAHSAGKSAIDGQKEYERKLDALSRTYKANLTPEQQRLFDREIAPLDADARRVGLVHAGNETKKYVQETAVASADQFALDAIAAPSLTKRTEYLKRGVEELASLGEKVGWSPEKLMLEGRKYVSNAHVRIAERISENDPIAGLEYIVKQGDKVLPEDAGPTMRRLTDQAKSAVTADAGKARVPRAIASGSAADVIREFEGYRATPYWDVNAHRVGYGSDTVTQADGSVVRVAKGMKITRTDAERDLQRRIDTEFVPGIKKMVGAAKWAGLPSSAQAALASVAYNYGSLPFSVANAVVMGDLDAIADAVEGLKGHNGGVNAKRRTKEAAMIRSGVDRAATTPGTGGEEAGTGEGGNEPAGSAVQFSERTETLLSHLPVHLAAELRASADAGVKAATAAQAAAFKAERAAVTDGYKLRIADGDLSLTREEILSDARTDDGDKAALLNAYNEKNKSILATQAGVEAFQAGKLAIDPYDADGRKLVDGVFSTVSVSVPREQVGPTALEIIRQTGVAPGVVVNAARGDLASGKIASVAAAAEFAQRIIDVNPAALERREGGKEVADAAALFKHLTEIGLTPELAASRIIDMRDPEKRRERAALLDSKPIKDFIKSEAVEGNVRDIFDPGMMGFDPRLGATPAQSAAMVAEYGEVLKESLFDAAGDTGAAKALAADRFKRRYGVSAYALAADGSTNIVTRHPPELTYRPDARGSHAYLGEQAKAALAGQGITATAVYLQADLTTEQDVKAGKPPRYVLFYADADGVIEQFRHPFFASPPDVAGNLKSEIGKASQRRDMNRLMQEAARDREGVMDRFLDSNPLTGGLENLGAR